MGGAFGTHRKRRNAVGTLMGKPDENKHLKDIDIDGSGKLKWFFKKLHGRTWAAVNCFVVKTRVRFV